MVEAGQLAFNLADGSFALPDEEGYRSGFEKSLCFGCKVNCCHGGVALWIKEEDLGSVFVEPDEVGQRRDGQVLVIYKRRCEHSQEDGSCGIYDDPARPQQCAEFPYGPDVTDPDMPPEGCSLPVKQSSAVEIFIITSG